MYTLHILMVFRYFTAAYDEPRRRQIYRVKWDDRDNTQPSCAICDLEEMEVYKDRCGWINPVFAEDGRSVVLNCRGNATIQFFFIRTSKF